MIGEGQNENKWWIGIFEEALLWECAAVYCEVLKAETTSDTWDYKTWLSRAKDFSSVEEDEVQIRLFDDHAT